METAASARLCSGRQRVVPSVTSSMLSLNVSEGAWNSALLVLICTAGNRTGAHED